MSTYNPNDPAANTNNRLPDLTLPGEYPYVRFYQYRDGSWERQDEFPGNEGWSKGHISGTYIEHTPLGGTKHFSTNTHHEYIVGGHSQTAELNHDVKIGASVVNRISADHYSEHGNDHITALGGDHVHVTGGSSFLHATNGTQVTSTGDHVSDHNDGSHHVNIAGDDIKFTGGVKYTYANSDIGEYAPNGNKDSNVGVNYNIQAGNTITIKVGSSVITVQGQSITIHDGNGNEMGMNTSQMWMGNPQNYNIPVYLGGNGQNTSLYAPVGTLAGPSINVYAKYQPGVG